MIKKWLTAVWRLFALPESLITSARIFFPIAIVGFLIYLVINPIDEKGKAIIILFSSITFPLSGLLLIAILIYVFGRWLVWEEKSGKYFFYFLLRKIPIFGKFIQPKKGGKSSWQPCCFWKTPTVLVFGFISGEQEIKDNRGHSKMIVSIFSTPPNEVILVEKKLIIKLNIGFEAIIQINTTFGLHHPPNLELIPWEDETLEGCLERFNRCPLY